MEGYVHSTYGDGFADVYDDWYGDITDTDACVAAIHELAVDAAGSERTPVVLELGIGTGRIAIPLSRAGVDVRGIDGSAAMLDRLRHAGGAMPVHLGDFSEVRMPAHPDDRPAPAADCVLLAYNTFFNLSSVEAQASCLRSAAAVLADRGCVVIEAFVPPAPHEEAADPTAVRVRHLRADLVVLTAAVHDRAEQTMSGQYVELRESGIRLRPWHLRYASPEQLDRLAAAAGLELALRWADWDRGGFDSSSERHISVYRPRSPAAADARRDGGTIT